MVDLTGVRLTSQLKSTLLMLDIWNAVQNKGKWTVGEMKLYNYGERQRMSRRAARAAKKLGLVYRHGTVTAK